MKITKDLLNTVITLHPVESTSGDGVITYGESEQFYGAFFYNTKISIKLEGYEIVSKAVIYTELETLTNQDKIECNGKIYSIFEIKPIHSSKGLYLYKIVVY